MQRTPQSSPSPESIRSWPAEIHSTSLASLSALPAGSVDFYALPHRGLRWVLAQLLELAGRTDFDREEERVRLLGQVTLVCELFEHHLEHEERFVHPALARIAPALASVLDEEHAEHRTEMTDLIDLARRMVSRPAYGRQLYLCLSRFTLENLAHMELEEVTVQRTLEENFDVETLEQLHGALLNGISSEVMFNFLCIILPAISGPQRQEILSAPRATMPASAFVELVSGTSIHLPEKQRHELLSWSRGAA